MIFRTLIFLIVVNLMMCCDFVENVEAPADSIPDKGVSLVVLGTVQDAGSPQIGCKKECCKNLFEHPDPSRKVVALGLIDHDYQEKFLFEATPDLPAQMEQLNRLGGFDLSVVPDAIFLTHAHIGHYTGLMYFGKEAMNANNVPVYTMPRMNDFLRNNGPWSQLCTNENIQLDSLKAGMVVMPGERIQITPLPVPHRDEYSETVGFLIEGPSKSALFIPDIDKWEKWDADIIEWVKKVDYAFLDATFYDGEEINNRDISEIPHPFVVESFETFDGLSPEDRNKIYFIHFNHTNPLLNAQSKQAKEVLERGYNITTVDMVFEL